VCSFVRIHRYTDDDNRGAGHGFHPDAAARADETGQLTSPEPATGKLPFTPLDGIHTARVAFCKRLGPASSFTLFAGPNGVVFLLQ
jgi:hypothetical protein